MSEIKVFTFNAFSVNTLVLYDETKECTIVDCGCSNIDEQQQLTRFITNNHLTPVHLLNTHYHVDHIIGNRFIKETYGLVPEAHQAGEVFWEKGRMWGAVFGVAESDMVKAEKYLKENDIVRFGTTELHVLETPGHAAGSLCFYNKKENYVIVGDVLFLQSIGRTDLPTGNHDLLIDQVVKKLFTLPEKTTVIPGHGPFTEIGFEKRNNPFF